MNYLHEYKTFNSTQELNHHVKQHTNRRYYDMNETQRNVLQILSQYSVKYTGASHLRIQTIANAVGKSSRTVERALKALVELNIIEKVNTIRRVSGGQGANIYRILPYVVEPEVTEREEVAKATQAKDNAPIVEKETANSLSYKQSRSRNGSAGETTNDEKRGLRTAIPTAIYDAIAPYFDTKGVYDTYGILLRAKASIKKDITLEDFASEYVDVFYNVIRKYKLGEVRSLSGLLYSAWKRVTSEINRRLAFASGDNPLYFDWLA